MGAKSNNIPKKETQNNIIINAKESYNSSFKIDKILCFESKDEIFYLVYNYFYNIFLYNLTTNQFISKISGKACKDIRHIFDDYNKIDLILIVSDFLINIFNIRNLECICEIQNNNNLSWYNLGSFIKENNYINIAVCDGTNSQIEIFNLNGKKEKSLSIEGQGKINILEIYYDKKLKNNYIITGKKTSYSGGDSIITFDYNKNQIYNNYMIEKYPRNIIIHDFNDEVRIICSIYHQILIFDFHSDKMINKIKFKGCWGICNWNNNYLIAGKTTIFANVEEVYYPDSLEKHIKGRFTELYLINLDNNKIKKINEDFYGDKKYIDLVFKSEDVSIVKINHPKYKNCLIYKDCFNVIRMITLNDLSMK